MQFIFLRSLRKIKSKDFLKFILMIFYFEYPLKTWWNSFFATYVILCISSSRSYFSSGRSRNYLPVHLSKHKICFFKPKAQYCIDLFFKKCDFPSFVPNSLYNMALFSTKSTKWIHLAFVIVVEGVSFLSVLYFILTMDVLSKCPFSRKGRTTSLFYSFALIMYHFFFFQNSP